MRAFASFLVAAMLCILPANAQLTATGVGGGFGPAAGGGSVTFDAKPTGGTAGWTSINATSPATITTLTVSGCSNRGIVVSAWTGSSGLVFPAGFTITRDTGETFTQISGTLFTDAALTSVGALYGLLNPTSGNVTITAAWTGGTSNEIHITAFAFCGVNQGSIAAAFPNGTAATPGTSTTASVTVTSAANHKTVATFAENIGNFTASNGQLNSVFDNGGPNLGVAADYQNGAATVAMTATINTSGLWNAIGCDVSP